MSISEYWVNKMDCFPSVSKILLTVEVSWQHFVFCCFTCSCLHYLVFIHLHSILQVDAVEKYKLGVNKYVIHIYLICYPSFNCFAASCLGQGNLVESHHWYPYRAHPKTKTGPHQLPGWCCGASSRIKEHYCSHRGWGMLSVICLH